MTSRATGCIVLAQMECIAKENSLRPRQIKIPRTLVDGLVVASPEIHWMSYATTCNAGYSSEIKMGVALNPIDVARASSSRGGRCWKSCSTRWSTWASACPRASR
jgi:acyl CoA:acetate/3-ketoacid CoA transferase